MKHFVVLTIIISLVSCSKQVHEIKATYFPANTNASISIILTPEHPYLAEYNRTLKITKGGVEVYRKKLFIDSGGYANTNLYYDKKSYILLDINGDLYEIDKNINVVTTHNYWNTRELPKNFIGAYEFIKKEFRFISNDERKEKEMKLLKGG